MRARDLTDLAGTAVASCFALLLASSAAQAQPPAEMPTATPETVPAVPAAPEHEQVGPTPAPAVAPHHHMMAEPARRTMGPPPGPTDHAKVVGLWGVEARRLATVQRTPGQETLGCNTNCPVDLNALSLRKWVSPNYAYHAGLVFALGGGSRREATGTGSYDTYLGIGPTLGASFALADWRHVTVSFSPMMDAVFFMPGSSRPKTLLLQARGLFEGEVHLGFWDLPQVSVTLSSGLGAGFTWVTKGKRPAIGGPATAWSVGFTGQQSLWDLVTNAAVRYYF